MKARIITLGHTCTNPRNRNDRQVIDPKGLSPTIKASAGHGGGDIPMIPEIKRL